MEFLHDLKIVFKEWFQEKDNSINILFPNDIINYPEDTTPEERLHIYNLLKETGVNPYKKYIFFELKSREGNDSNPWFVIQRVGKKQFFRTKWLSEPTPFNFRPGKDEAETNNSDDIRNPNGNPIEKGRIRYIHMKNFAIWINRYLTFEEAELNLKQFQNEENNIPIQNISIDYIDLIDDGSSPALTKEELKEVRELLRFWRETADDDDTIPEETKDKFDKAATAADFVITENKIAPRNKIAKIVGSVFKIANEEGIKIVVRKGLEKVPKWLSEDLPKFLEEHHDKIQ